MVFALMLYYLLRTGILLTLSTDILALLGVSAAGATGGKLTQMAKRRLSFPNWAWLRRHNWLPSVQDDVSPRARWAELITDFDGKEFNVLQLQMAIFSRTLARRRSHLFHDLHESRRRGIGCARKSPPRDLLGLVPTGHQPERHS